VNSSIAANVAALIEAVRKHGFEGVPANERRHLTALLRYLAERQTRTSRTRVSLWSQRAVPKGVVAPIGAGEDESDGAPAAYVGGVNETRRRLNAPPLYR
jgi:hypothetical protein